MGDSIEFSPLSNFAVSSIDFYSLAKFSREIFRISPRKSGGGIKPFTTLDRCRMTQLGVRVSSPFGQHKNQDTVLYSYTTTMSECRKTEYEIKFLLCVKSHVINYPSHLPLSISAPYCQNLERVHGSFQRATAKCIILFSLIRTILICSCLSPYMKRNITR